ncbi:DeoR/GlpR family DNA-binding transcription regulator [Chitinasiproducens palmae]|uniref:DNA-binding transcriptional regulator of sugar metabolism, DeoR/GlpR family n=1 Tax=Chitinasiproducens palmae TaxID=1770053 RepID=A0A1H2PLM8_9BURK|nr:DeoR/GlpR family DNA-binding transcription regulator [Chitinasiproducens palmae]SDV47347.1 DNA-binding transcriptional regulator of sugar metabolism, DeoR/GlpR family [Chitinasiproducens palmae]
MLQEIRLKRITALLASLQQVSTERVAQDLGVSRETVRRDVLQLEAQGSLRRVHGGIVALTESHPEPPLAVRRTARAAEKRAIARAALRLVEPGQTLFIDAGSTTALLAEALAVVHGLRVLTNGVELARRLNDQAARRVGIETILLGGRLDDDGIATYGDITVAEVHRYRADLAMLSPVGISAQHGASSYALHEAVVARAMVSCAARCVILADHSKLGQTSRSIYAMPEQVGALVTDARGAQDATAHSFRQAGCEVVVA